MNKNKTKKPFTEQEQKVMELLVDAHNEFVKLDKNHNSEINEWIEGIHKCQSVLMNRIVTRDYPNYFYQTRE